MKELLLVSSLLFACLLNVSSAHAKTSKALEDDAAKIAEYQERCETINTLIVNSEYKLSCYTNYNHYAPTSKTKKSISSLKIANYNLLHPGTSKALFKDYALVAKIINSYDVVSGLELLATVGRDEQNNKAVLDLIRNSAGMVSKLRQQKTKLTDIARIQDIESKIVKLVTDTRTAYDLYRAPGYLRVLQELKKLDPSWGLILSPRGDSALVGSVEELTGYYYRGSVATPTVNPHCEEFAEEGAGSPVACFITLTADFMGKDVVQHFSRRPFMATFKANNSLFTLVTSHVVFTYSGDEEAEKDLMMKTFGVETYKGLGTGINGSNFARYAEVKNTLDFMNLYKKKYKDERIMFMGDTNLVSNNAFWPEVLKAFPGSQLLITDATTLSPTRYTSTKKETNGVANDYDHFILNKKTFSECNDGEVYNYYKEGIYRDIENRYIIRQEVAGFTNKNFDLDGETGSDLDGDIPPVDDPGTIQLEYPLTTAGQAKMDKYVTSFGKYLNSIYTVKKNEVVVDDFQREERIEGLKRRVFLRQLTNPFYFRYMQEVLSDHFPIGLTCKL